jgi:hypothetical protein
MDAKWWQKLTLPLARWAKNNQLDPFGSRWHGRHRQFMFMIVCFLKKNQFFCGKRDNSNLNIDIYFSIIHNTVNFLPSFNSFGSIVPEEKIFKNRPIRNKNCLWRPCLLMDRNKMSNLYRGPSKDMLDWYFPNVITLVLRGQFRLVWTYNPQMVI